MKITEQERTIQNLQLLIVFMRGYVYLSAWPFAEKPVDLWYESQFGAKYPNIKRYRQFAELILVYPGLLVSELTFSQITKHYRRIQEHLLKTADLAEKLRTEVLLSAQDIGIKVKPAEIQIMNKYKTKFSKDPDYVYETAEWYGQTSGKEPVDDLNEIVGWIQNEAKTAAEEKEKELSEKIEAFSVELISINKWSVVSLDDNSCCRTLKTGAF